MDNPRATIQDVTISLLRDGIDSILQADYSIPLGPLGTISKAVAAYHGIKNAMLQHKIQLFLDEAESVSDYLSEERIDWVTNENKEAIGRQVITILERADDERKASVYGRLYCSLITKSLSREQFNRLCSSVDRSFFDDLEHLSRFDKPMVAPEHLQPIAESLQSAGLLSQAGIDGGDAGGASPGGYIYRLNIFGRLLVESMAQGETEPTRAF